MRTDVAAVLALGLGACGGAADAGSDAETGTLAYLAQSTGSVHVLDLGTRADTLVDGGHFAGISLAPDGQHVAYQGDDEMMKVADLAGHVTPLTPSGGCAGAAWWVSDTVFLYCISTPQVGGSMLATTAAGSQPRNIPGFSISVSADATLDAYTAANGDITIENIDGSARRVLVPSIDPTAVNALEYVAGFTPDQTGLLVVDESMYPSRLHVVRIADGTSIDVADVHFPGTPFGAPSFLGASSISPDGSEILMESETALVAASFATGATRTLVTFPSQVSAGAAAFLDATHVIWVRDEDRSDGDEGRFYLSLHVAGPAPTDDVTLDDPQIENQLWNSIAVLPSGEIAMTSDVLLVNADGSVIAGNDQSSDDSIAALLGIAPSGALVGTTDGGILEWIEPDGSKRDVVDAASGPNGANGGAAVYVPVGH